MRTEGGFRGHFRPGGIGRAGTPEGELAGPQEVFGLTPARPPTHDLGQDPACEGGRSGGDLRLGDPHALPVSPASMARYPPQADARSGSIPTPTIQGHRPRMSCTPGKPDQEQGRKRQSIDETGSMSRRLRRRPVPVRSLWFRADRRAVPPRSRSGPKVCVAEERQLGTGAQLRERHNTSTQRAGIS